MTKTLRAKIVAEYEVEVRDRNGKLVSKCRGVSKSFLRNWIRMIRQMMNQDDGTTFWGVTLKDTGGNDRTFAGGGGTNCTMISARAGAGVDAYGIQVGTSDIAFDKTHYSLQGKIVTGTGSGQLVYGAVTFEDYTEWDSNVGWRQIRAFTNSSGAVVTVKEIGIAIYSRNFSGTYYYMIARDVLASPQSVPDVGTLTVRYRLYTTY